MEIEFRSIVHHYWHLGLTAKEIHSKMVESYGCTCPSLSFVKKWIMNFNHGRTELEDLPRSGRPKVIEYIDLVHQYIEENPFSSARSVASALNISKNTVIRILTEDLHRRKVNAKWVPHFLSTEQIEKRISDSARLLTELNKLSEKKFMQVVTCDESWFYLNYFHQKAYLPRGEILEIPNRMISEQKIMIFTAFSANGFHLLEILPPKTKFTAHFLCTSILPKLDEIVRSQSHFRKNSKIYLHFDNAKSHTAKMTLDKMEQLGMIKLPHPAYSPDVSPNDFFLYGYVKNKLKGRIHDNIDDLVKSIMEIIEKIDQSTWKSVMENWKERLLEVINSNGSYQ